jgi:hypothetical protein
VTNPARKKGTAWETAVVRYLAGRGLRATRKPLAGNQDKADIDLLDLPDIVIEAKNTQRTTLAEFLDQALKEAGHAGARVCAVWQHRRLAGSPGQGYVLLSGDHFTEILLDLVQSRDKIRLLEAMLAGEVAIPAGMARDILEGVRARGGQGSQVR